MKEESADPAFGTEDDFALRQAQVAVVGLGLMGGSLALALRQRQACRQVVGVARRAENIAQALASGAIDRGTTSLAEGVADADIVVLALPVSAILEAIPQVGALVKPGCLLLDVGSTKVRIVETMGQLPPAVQAVGGHPMCGKESSGFEAADPALYQEAPFVFTPSSHSSPAALRLAAALARAVGARPLFMDAARHDHLVAAISHLPYLAAIGVVATAEEVAAKDGLLWELAASGFRDTTRIAACHVRMMADILLTNRDAVLAMAGSMMRKLKELSALVAQGDQAALERALAAPQQRRSSLFRETRGRLDEPQGGRRCS